MAERDDKLGIEFGRELVLVFLQIKVRGRQRFAVPRQVERNDAEICCDLGIAKLMPILAAVGSRGVQA
jgi:hypothetical protein